MPSDAIETAQSRQSVSGAGCAKREKPDAIARASIEIKTCSVAMKSSRLTSLGSAAALPAAVLSQPGLLLALLR